MTVALIVNNRVYNVFSSPSLPDWPPYQDGTKPLLVDVTGQDAQEGDKYVPATKKIIHIPARPAMEEWNGYYPNISWNGDAFEWVVDYVSVVQSHIDSLLLEIASKDYRSAKAQVLGVSREDLYPGDREWYLGMIGQLHTAQGYLQELIEANHG